MNYYLSLETAKQLKEWGCELESKNSWFGAHNGKIIDKSHYYGGRKLYYAYHILEDICAMYAKQFFGEKNIKEHKSHRGGRKARIPEQILYFLQNNKKEEAEKYILDNCLFNPKNKC